jgi:hypothetical protein
MQNALQKILLLRENPGLKCTQTDAIFKKFNMKTELKQKVNVTQKYFGF